MQPINCKFREKTKMKKQTPKILRLLFCLLALNTVALLSGENISAQEIKILKVPQQNLNLSKNQRIPPRPRALTQGEKLQRAQKILEGKNQKVNSLANPITISVANLFASDKVVLSLYRTQLVTNSEGGLAWFSSNPSADAFKSLLAIYFLAPSPGQYLMDLTVSPVLTPKFTLSAQGNVLTSNANQPGEKHLSFVAETTQANETVNLSVSADGEWYFYSCEISQIK
jgi:hypothetical protein